MNKYSIADHNAQKIPASALIITKPRVSVSGNARFLHCGTVGFMIPYSQASRKTEYIQGDLQ